MGVLEEKNINSLFKIGRYSNVLRGVCYFAAGIILGFSGIGILLVLLILSIMLVSNFLTHMKSMGMGMIYAVMKENKAKPTKCNYCNRNDGTCGCANREDDCNGCEIGEA